MKKIAFLFPLFIPGSFLSCTHGTRNPSGSALSSPAALRVQVANSYLALRVFFARNPHGRIDSSAEIPFRLVNSWLSDSDKIDTTFNSSINPIDYIENKTGRFFLIQLNCGAGGYCHTYRLMAFRPGGQFVTITALGQEEGDEGFSRNFVYTVQGDTAIAVSQWDVDNDTGKISDSLAKTIALTPQLSEK